MDPRYPQRGSSILRQLQHMQEATGWIRCTAVRQVRTAGRRSASVLLALAAAFLLIGLLVLEEQVRLAGGCRCVWLIGWGLKGASVAGL
jgi:hypothetical protein